jgi:capsular polysaccharide export protein
MDLDSYKSLLNKRLLFNSQSNVLLLQGPVGNFFNEFAKHIIRHGGRAFKIHFTFAEKFFYDQKEEFFYKNTIDEWPKYFIKFVKKNKIDRVYLMNDSRPYHKPIVKICTDMDIDLFVFEDGYFRPGYITLEPFGVNGNSQFPKFSFDNLNGNQYLPNLEMNLYPKNYSRILFSLISNFNFITSRNYKPYRPINSFYWTVRLLRKYLLKVISILKDSIAIKKILKTDDDIKIFFVPLQVFDDTQIKYHSKYKNTFEFILEILQSFGALNSRTFKVIIKQHPGDRGAINYKNFIKEKAELYGISKNICFNSTTNADELINIADGVILINSTVGINSLLKNKRVHCSGVSVYRELCQNIDLNEFINNTLNSKYSYDTNNSKFLIKLKNATQIKGSFHK